jgi:hypothetical protein
MVRFARKCAVMFLAVLLVLGVVPMGQSLPEWVQTSSGALVFADGGYGDNGKFLAPIQQHSGISTPISNREELENIKNDVSGKYHLVEDIDLSGAEWIPIPNFSGMLYGQGHIVSGMTVQGVDSAGLFSSVGDAVIRDIG